MIKIDDYWGVKPKGDYTNDELIFATQRILDELKKGKIPKEEDVKIFFSRDNDLCNHYKGYCPQIFGDTECKGDRKGEYNVIVYIKETGQFGAHILCKSCLDEYIKLTSPYNRKGNVFESPNKKVFVYKR